jgi:5'-deoxynucleotidase YfbR-like HD superfamily hydrolase
MTADTTTAPSGAQPRAFVLLKSRRRLDLLNPGPHAWTDDDLAAGLSRTMRWGGASRWEHPLSVAQHSLTVLTIREADGALTPGEALRELLHDATEFMLGWDCITPLKAQLGEPFRALEARLQSAIDARYRLRKWTPEAYAIHKRADRLAAASEAFHVVGWSRVEMRKILRIAEVPLLQDPLSPCGFAPWEPWPPRVAQRLFIERFNALERAHQSALQMIPSYDLCPFPTLQGAEHHVEA